MSSLDKKLLTIAKVAERLSMGNNAIRVLKLLRDLKIPVVELPFVGKRVDPADLDKAIEEAKRCLGIRK